MARKKHHGMPGWFPFALAASALGVLFAGAKTGWGHAGEPEAKKMPPEPPPPQSGVKDWFPVGAFS